MFDFGLNMILLSLQVSICYLTAFYSYLTVNMRKRQVICHIIVSLIWGFVLGNLCWQMTSAIEYIWIIIIELGYAYITMFLFAEGSFFCNAIRLINGAQVAGSILGGLYYLFAPQFMQNYMIPGRHHDLSVGKLALYDILIIFVVLLLRPLVIRIVCDDKKRDLFYKVFFGVLQVSYIHEFILRLFEDWEKGEELHIIYRFALALCAVVVLVYMVIRSKRRNIQERQRIIEQETAIVGRQYEKMMEANREIHMLRHEWNRQMELIRDAKGYVPSADLLNYVEKLDEKTRHFMMLSLSGNLYLDTVLEHNCTVLEKKGIVVEMVIEPLKISQSVTMDLVSVVEELFQFVNAKVKSAVWCRFSIRRKQGRMVCQVEIGYSDKKEYYLYKIMDGIGNRMWVRQCFPVTREITDKRNGAVRYHFDRQTVELAGMISVD